MPSIEITISARDRIKAMIRENVVELEKKVMSIVHEHLVCIDAKMSPKDVQQMCILWGLSRTLMTSSNLVRTIRYFLPNICASDGSIREVIDLIQRSLTALPVGSLVFHATRTNGHTYPLATPMLVTVSNSESYYGVTPDGMGNMTDINQFTFMLSEDLDDWFENSLPRISNDYLQGLIPATEEDLNEWF